MRNQLVDRGAVRRAEIDRLDATSRNRALTEAESRRLEALLYRDDYAPYRRVGGQTA
jgi:hypothetical protein